MPIKKEVAKDDDYDDDDDDDDDYNDEKKKTAEYRLSFMDSYRLMPGKLSDLIDNLSGIHDKECKNSMKEKIKSKYKLIGFRNGRLRYKCEINLLRYPIK